MAGEDPLRVLYSTQMDKEISDLENGINRTAIAE
jgi:hypothetical protein